MLVLFLILEEKSSIFSLLSMMLAIGLSYMDFIMLRYVPSRPTVQRVSYHKWMSNFVKSVLSI